MSELRGDNYNIRRGGGGGERNGNRDDLGVKSVGVKLVRIPITRTRERHHGREADEWYLWPYPSNSQATPEEIQVHTVEASKNQYRELKKPGSNKEMDTKFGNVRLETWR